MVLNVMVEQLWYMCDVPELPLEKGPCGQFLALCPLSHLKKKCPCLLTTKLHATGNQVELSDLQITLKLLFFQNPCHTFDTPCVNSLLQSYCVGQLRRRGRMGPPSSPRGSLPQRADLRLENLPKMWHQEVPTAQLL